MCKDDLRMSHVKSFFLLIQVDIRTSHAAMVVLIENVGFGPSVHTAHLCPVALLMPNNR